MFRAKLFSRKTVPKNWPKSETAIGDNFEICWPQMAINAPKLPTWLENFKICWTQMAGNALKIVHHGWRKF